MLRELHLHARRSFALNALNALNAPIIILMSIYVGIWKLSGRLAQASLPAWGRLSLLAPQASGAIA